MKTKIGRLAVLSVTALALAVSGFAQTDAISAAAGDKYVISAKAGGVNFVEGTVTVSRQAGTSGRLLKGDSLEVGDRVSTAADGKAEILLNPGSYLRLAGNSSFEFKTTTLDDLQLKIGSGSAMLEVFAGEDFTVTVEAGGAKYTAVESGVFRVEARADGTSSFAVWKGKARVGDSTEAQLKSGREATVAASGLVAIAKFDRDEKDELELWSKGRAKELAKLSNRLRRDGMRTALMQSFLGRRWNMYNSFGLWVYDPFGFNYCFLPFGYGWYSPYGYGFGRSIWYYDLPPVIYTLPPSSGTRTGTTVSRRTRTNPGSADGGETKASPDYSGAPPFVRMQRTTGIGRSKVDTSDPGDASDRSSRSVFIPSAPPVSVAPPVSAPTRVDSGNSGSGRSKSRP